MDSQPKAFVLMPFDEAFDNAYEYLIFPSLTEAGYEVGRADSPPDQHQVLKTVVEGIARADLVVADLTGLNPNVFYELGIAHGLQKPTVIVTQCLESVPFDLRAYRVERYLLQVPESETFKRRLKEIADLHRQGAVAFGSPVTDFGPDWARREIARSLPASLEGGRDGGGDEERGRLDYVEDLEASTKVMLRVLEEISEDTVSLGGKMNVHTERLVAMRQRPVQPSAREVREVASAAAADMEESAKRLASLVPQMDEAIDGVSQNTEQLLGLASPSESAEEREQLSDYMGSSQQLLDATTEALKQVRQYRDVIGGLKGISADVTRASRRLTNGLDRVIASMEKVQAFASRTMLLLEEKLQAGAPAPAPESTP
ncbi:MAG: hypothetical protein FJX75_17870 [Armatimonadetes bacterium]|nr:hypothetical protein [Armatimonadota bacterium]